MFKENRQEKYTLKIIVKRNMIISNSENREEIAMSPFSNETIDKNVPVPMYYQLKKMIQDMIKDGRLKPGDMLPTELELSDMFSISRTTTRQAIMELVMEGVLYRVKSKGTFVAENRVVQDFTNVIRASHNLLEAQNVKTTTKVLKLEIMKADDHVRKMLRLEPGEEIVHLKRLRFVNGEPNVLADAYLPMICKDMLDADMEKTGLYQFLDSREETTPVYAVRNLEAVCAEEEEAELLKIEEGAPIQLTTSLTYTKTEQPIEYSIAKFRGDRNVFRCEIRI